MEREFHPPGINANVIVAEELATNVEDHTRKWIATSSNVTSVLTRPRVINPTTALNACDAE